MINVLPQPQSRILLRYAISIVAIATALLLSYLFWEFVSKAPFIFLLTGIVISAWAGGFGSGVLATLLSIIGFNVLLIMTPGRQFEDTESVFLLVVFASVGVAISYLQHERFQAQQELEALNLQLDTILNNIADGVTSQVPSGKVIYANPQAAYLLGFNSPESLVATPAQDIIDRYRYFRDDGTPMQLEELANYQALQSGELRRGTFQLHDTVTDQRRWLLLKTTPFFDKKGKKQWMINVFQDITADKEREANTAQVNLLLDTHRTRLMNTLRNVPGIVWEGSNWGAKIEFVNDYAQQLLGYDKKDWLTTENFWKTIIHPDDWDDALEQMSSIFDNITNRYKEIEYRCVTKSGDVIYVRSHITLLDAPTDDSVGRICGVITDISRRKAAEDALERSSEALRRSNDELKQFAYVASHDLQEPLRMVSSYLQLIEKRYKDQLDDDGREFIYFAVDGANRMKSLINDLLTFSRVETNSQQPEPIDFETLLNTVMNNLAVSIEETGAVIEYDDLPKVVADKRQMMQLMQNLISNAITFRDETRPPHIHIKANKVKGCWQFAIADNGIGIEPQYEERIFQIFQRLHGIGQYDGTGIGLAICKKVVERHGGQIWLKSVPDVGTTFYFTLPIKQQNSQERAITNASN